MTTTKKKKSTSQLNKNIREMQNEINGYNVPKRIADAMMELAKAGFEFSGHGCGMGAEDWGIIFSNKSFKAYSYVSFIYDGSKIVTDVTVAEEDCKEAWQKSLRKSFKGTARAVKFIKENKLHTKTGLRKFLKDIEKTEWE